MGGTELCSVGPQPARSSGLRRPPAAPSCRRVSGPATTGPRKRIPSPSPLGRDALGCHLCGLRSLSGKPSQDAVGGPASAGQAQA